MKLRPKLHKKENLPQNEIKLSEHYLKYKYLNLKTVKWYRKGFALSRVIDHLNIIYFEA